MLKYKEHFKRNIEINIKIQNIIEFFVRDLKSNKINFHFCESINGFNILYYKIKDYKHTQKTSFFI